MPGVSRASLGWSAGVRSSTCSHDTLGHAEINIVPFAVESCSCMGQVALMFMPDSGNDASAIQRILKGVFVSRATQLTSIALQKGIAEMYRRSGMVLSQEHGIG